MFLISSTFGALGSIVYSSSLLLSVPRKALFVPHLFWCRCLGKHCLILISSTFGTSGSTVCPSCALLLGTLESIVCSSSLPLSVPRKGLFFPYRFCYRCLGKHCLFLISSTFGDLGSAVSSSSLLLSVLWEALFDLFYFCCLGKHCLILISSTFGAS